MNIITKKSIISAGAGLLLLAGALPVGAQSLEASTSVQVGVKGQISAQKIALIKDRAGKEVDRRLLALDKLATRVQTMKRVSDSEKANISATVQSETSNLNGVKTKISADSDVTVLRDDVKSIFGSYRIFALVIPKGHILAAADRINTIVDLMNTLSAKIQARITVASGAGKNVTSLQATLVDVNAKIADAKVQANAAVSIVTPLTPDQGDKAQFDANKSALLDARSKIKNGAADLRVAREEIGTIVTTLKSFHLNASSTASTTVSQ